MTDREKVIKGLEEVQHYIKVENLPAHTLKAKLVIDDALALLKAQEPVMVQKKPMEEILGIQTWDWVCGKCGGPVLYSAKYCSWCGQAVKWE